MPRAPSNKIIVFTRLPQPGATKTRLIPALGAEGAAAFHDRLARHAIGRASDYAMRHPGITLEIRITGGSPADARRWLGSVRNGMDHEKTDGVSLKEHRRLAGSNGLCRFFRSWPAIRRGMCFQNADGTSALLERQGDGDLGARMARASSEAIDSGCAKVVIIGTDCPRLDDPHLDAAFRALERSEVVFGPALDGGYYLVGLSTRCPEIFAGIPWGGDQVLAASLQRGRNLGLHIELLDKLPDVDTPEDLPDGEAALAEGATVSVVIPALDEARRLGATLDRVMAAAPHEIIVADGGSTDATPDIARSRGAAVVAGARGRAAQMNLGASAATGEFLLFLHADTLPPPNYPDLIRNSLNRPGVAAGAFRFELEGELPGAVLVEKLTALRCRLRHLPYGDQGLFLRRSIFHHLGGFPDWPVMEDLDFVRTLRRLGRISITREPARTSARRWRDQGLVRTFLRHQLMLAAHLAGLPPSRIAKLRR